MLTPVLQESLDLLTVTPWIPQVRDELGFTMGWLEGGHLLTHELGEPLLPGWSMPLSGCVIFGSSLSFSDKAVHFLHGNLHASAQTEHCAYNFREAQISVKSSLSGLR